MNYFFLEILDFGYPQNTDTGILKTFITQQGVKSQVRGVDFILYLSYLNSFHPHKILWSLHSEMVKYCYICVCFAVTQTGTIMYLYLCLWYSYSDLIYVSVLPNYIEAHWL